MCVYLCVCMFDLYRRQNGSTDFLQIFTVFKGSISIFLLKMDDQALGAWQTSFELIINIYTYVYNI